MVRSDIASSHAAFAWLPHLLLSLTSILFLPASLLALFYNYAALVLCPQDGLRRHVHRSRRFRSRKVLITGVSTPAGLRVARALFTAGHTVVGADVGAYPILSPARWSKAVSKFYNIARPSGPDGNDLYAEDVFRVIVKERAALWIDCSDGRWARAQAQAKEVVEERSSCICLMPTVSQILQFETRHGFQQLAQQLSLPSQEFHSIRSRNEIFNVISGSGGRKYLLKSPDDTSEPAMHTILPRGTVSQTYKDVAQMKLSKGSPWTIEQYIGGLAQFTACAVVVRGKLTAFTATSVSHNGDCKAVPTQSGLGDAMRQYVESFAEAGGDEFSSHLTVSFCLEEKATSAGVVQQILPLGGHLTPHGSLLLFDGKRGSVDLAKAYMALLATTTTELETYTGLPYTESASRFVTPAEPEIGVYFLYHDLKGLVVGPLLQLFTFRTNISSVARSWIVFLQHVLGWQEALYDFGDPLPLFWYTHVSAPGQFLLTLLQNTWSRSSIVESNGVSRKHGDHRLQNGR